MREILTPLTFEVQELLKGILRSFLLSLLINSRKALLERLQLILNWGAYPGNAKQICKELSTAESLVFAELNLLIKHFHCKYCLHWDAQHSHQQGREAR